MLYAYIINFFVTRKYRKFQKIDESNNVNIDVNIDGVNLHIFQTTWGISIKLSEEMWLVIVLNIIKKTMASSSLYKIHFWKKKQGGQIDPPSSLRVKKQAIIKVPLL